MSKQVRIYQMDIDQTTEQHLLSHTQRYIKLAVESGNRKTSPNRLTEIDKEIEAIRAERDSIIDKLRQAVELQVAR